MDEVQNCSNHERRSRLNYICIRRKLSGVYAKLAASQAGLFSSVELDITPDFIIIAVFANVNM
jgi:hypothetical protein